MNPHNETTFDAEHERKLARLRALQARLEELARERRRSWEHLGEVAAMVEAVDDPR